METKSLLKSRTPVRAEHISYLQRTHTKIHIHTFLNPTQSLRENKIVASHAQVLHTNYF